MPLSMCVLGLYRARVKKGYLYFWSVECCDRVGILVQYPCVFYVDTALLTLCVCSPTAETVLNNNNNYYHKDHYVYIIKLYIFNTIHNMQYYGNY